MIAILSFTCYTTGSFLRGEGIFVGKAVSWAGLACAGWKSARRGACPLAYREEADAAVPEGEPERAYPDGSVPSECWNTRRAFAREAPKKEGGGGPWSGI